MILDVVYNHTAEGNELGPTLSFKGIDNANYYRLMPDEKRYYINNTGTGNTVNLSAAEYKFNPSDSTVKSGQVTFNEKNDGDVPISTPTRKLSSFVRSNPESASAIFDAATAICEKRAIRWAALRSR